MIFDSREFLKLYLPGEVGVVLAKALAEFTPATLDGDYPIGDHGIVARVMGYHTRPIKETRLEAHRLYADVQCVISGAEQVRRYSRKGLSTHECYDIDKDVEFFIFPQVDPIVMELNSETFAIFFPQDAHVGQLPVGEPGKVIRKVVFKVPTVLFLPNGTCVTPEAGS